MLKVGLDFIAIKIGDINHSATAYNSSTNIEQRSEDKYFNTKNISFEAMDIVPVELRMEDKNSISGFQFTLEYNQDKYHFHLILIIFYHDDN